ncbi:MAG: hypothetical protein AAGF26_17770 [Cyanobacteria bacterium P01_G01_bin.49]
MVNSWPSAYAASNKTYRPLKKHQAIQLLAQQAAENQQVTAENQQFTATFQDCTRSGTVVRCSTVIKSKQDINMNVDCNVNTGSRLFDNNGNVFQCSSVQVGSANSRTILNIRFPQDTPVKAIYTFSEVSSSSNLIDTFEINLSNQFLKFRNINILGTGER